MRIRGKILSLHAVNVLLYNDYKREKERFTTNFRPVATG